MGVITNSSVGEIPWGGGCSDLERRLL